AVTATSYTAAGIVQWTKSFLADAAPGPFAAAWDPVNSEWVIAGSFAGTLEVGTSDYDSSAQLDVVVIRLDPSTGNATRVVIIGGDKDDVVGGPQIPEATFVERHGYAGNALAILPDGSAVIAGWTNSPAIGV